MSIAVWPVRHSAIVECGLNVTVAGCQGVLGHASVGALLESSFVRRNFTSAQATEAGAGHPNVCATNPCLICACLHAGMHVCMCAGVQVCMCACVHACMACVHACMHAYMWLAGVLARERAGCIM